MDKLRLISLALLIAVFSISCSDSKEPAQDDYENATRLMDTGDYSSAIYILEGRLNEDNSDSRARLLMAAAYAGRAGILFTDFFDIAKLLTGTQGRPDQHFDPRGLAGLSELRSRSSGASKVIEFLDKVYKALYDVNQVLYAFRLIPTVEKQSDVKDLQKAISILNNADELSYSAIMYRGLLRISLLKYNIKNQYSFSLEANCQLDAKEFLDLLSELHNDLQNIYSDIAYGSVNEDRQDKILVSKRKLDKSFNNVKRFLSANLSANSGDINLSDVAKSVGTRCK